MTKLTKGAIRYVRKNRLTYPNYRKAKIGYHETFG